MIRRIDHVSIAVRDLEKARNFFLNVLGGKELFSAPVAPQKFRWTTIELGTSCFIELIDPLENDGFVQRFLETRGEGPHHITIQVNDIREVQRTLEEKGVSTFGFAEPFPGWKELYIHPKNAFGTLIQFAEFNPLDWINPGYIPQSYWEFAPPQKVGPEDGQVEVRRVETERGPEVEIHQGEELIRIPEARLADLIQALKKQGSPSVSPVK
jgi:methylmalonyl-CoA/ethylmalonyl-CoA epimerase